MSGHSKWATIHRQKEITDAKRGQAFTKLASAIIVAIRAGGGVTDPSSNFKLRLAIEKARQFNMPKDNIQRTLQRAQGKLGESIEEVVYEGYGPAGVAVLVEAATDNKQRTAQEVKNIMEKGGGNLTRAGAVAYLFERKGLIVINKPENAQEAILAIMDLGVEDVDEEADAIEVYVKPEELEKTKASLEQAGLTIASTELVMKPKTIVRVNDPDIAAKILGFMHKLEDQADVQRVYANFDIELLG